VWSAAALEKAHVLADGRNLYPPQVEQPQYSLLERSIERDVLPTARRLGMGVVVWSPLAGGILTGKYNDGVPKGSRAQTTDWLAGKLTDANLTRVRSFCAIATRLELEPGQLALAWILRQEGISSVITGATDPELVRSNARAAEVELPDGTVAEITQLFEPSGTGGKA
jgi:aryl-alcohol dehydrogenase-like predicted oxidoreductase